MNIKNPKVLKYTLLFLAILLTLFPFLYLAQYNHPSADDFCHSSKAGFLGFVSMQIDHWLTWSGRYSATALLSIILADHNDLFNYRFLPVLLLISYGISIFIFLRTLFIKSSLYDILALTFIILFLYIFKAPNITEAFYWLASSITYQLASILSLILFTIILKLLREKEKMKILGYTIIGTLLGVTIVGFNEVSLIYLCIILFLWLIGRIYETRKPEWSLITIVTFTILAAGVSLTAPGNRMRMSTVMVEQYNLSFSLSGSVQLAFWAITSWLPVLILLLVIFFNSLKRIVNSTTLYPKPKQVSWKFILLAIIFLFGLLALGYFPAYWSQGGRPPTRTINVIFQIFIFGSLGIVFIIMKVNWKKIKSLPKIAFILKALSAIALICYVLLLTNNIKTAYNDILLGKAEQYDKELMERYSVLTDCKDWACNIPMRLSVYPPTIFAYELALEPTEEIYYYNLCLKDYFNNTYTPPERKLKEQ